MTDLPKAFLAVIHEILGEEYESFLCAFRDDRHHGLRVNTSKISREEFERISPFHLTPVPWVDNGYYYGREDDPARHPFYAAGLYYLQEPSAMTPASRLPVEEGDRILDLCAAPGGKATALGAALKGSGQLVANDINTARARALLRNLELFGICNSFVTNEPPYIMAERFPLYFDKIMVDAPCSGEGMFRKNPAVIGAWLEKGPEYFSVLQRDIILHAADMLKPGGKMLYSTCTFSPLENEAVITWLLDQRPEMKMISMKDYEGFSEGLTGFREEEFHPDCRLARRIWPHRMGGEGHFLALLEKEGGHSAEVAEERKPKKKRRKKETKSAKHSGDRNQREILDDFFTCLKGPMKEKLDREHLEVRGEKVYFVTEKSYAEKGLHFLRNGVYLGDMKKNRFEPSQPFALSLSRDGWSPCLDFPQDDPRLEAYLRGESFDVADLVIPLPESEGRKIPGNGWHLILAEGYPLGFGKLAGTTLKNKYPPGWRVKK